MTSFISRLWVNSKTHIPQGIICTTGGRNEHPGTRRAPVSLENHLVWACSLGNTSIHPNSLLSTRARMSKQESKVLCVLVCVTGSFLSRTSRVARAKGPSLSRVAIPPLTVLLSQMLWWENCGLFCLCSLFQSKTKLLSWEPVARVPLSMKPRNQLRTEVAVCSERHWNTSRLHVSSSQSFTGVIKVVYYHRYAFRLIIWPLLHLTLWTGSVPTFVL